MSGFVIGFAVLFLMAAGFVWGRAGLRFTNTGDWRSYSVNDFYVLLFGRNITAGDGVLNHAIGWIGGMDLGVVFIVIGLVVYYFGVRNAKT